MGNTCKPMAVSFKCMTKFTMNKKIKRRRRNLKKKKGRAKKKIIIKWEAFFCQYTSQKNKSENTRISSTNAFQRNASNKNISFLTSKVKNLPNYKVVHKKIK